MDLTHIIGTVIGIGLTYVASRWSYGRQLLNLAKTALGIAKSTGLDDKIPKTAREIAEQAIIAANQREIELLVKQILSMPSFDEIEKAATAKGAANAPPPENVTIVPLDGTETWSKPFQKDG